MFDPNPETCRVNKPYVDAPYEGYGPDSYKYGPGYGAPKAPYGGE
jgi:hypothetical protein